MKLYVWQDVLRDYSAGMIVVLAPDLETAFATVRADPGTYQTHLEDMGKVEPTVVDLDENTKPQMWWVYGGG